MPFTMICCTSVRSWCSLWTVCKWALVLLLLSSSQSPITAQQAAANASVSCPGLQQGVCTAECQLATCAALADFYNSTLNADKPGDTRSWSNNQGWDLTTTFSCQQLITARSQQPSYCSWHGITCCDAAGIALQQCSAVHSVSALKVPVNGLNGSLDSPGIINNMLQLHACGLRGISLQGNDLSGSMVPEWGQLKNLVILDLANNWLNGTIPAQLRSLKQLQTLSLGTNFLTGPIPSWLGDLHALQVLNLGANAGQNPDGTTGLTGSLPEALSDLPELRVLNLETNALSGTIPRQICQRNNLTVLKLRSNMLEGVPVYLTDCRKLTQLDMSNNRFSGPIPDHMDFPQLAVLDASYNDFYGTIPDALYLLPSLGYLNLANNRLTGGIRRMITLMTYLTELSLSNNQLTGVIDENLWFLPQLRMLDLSHNRMNGSISSAIGLTFGLGEVVLDNNQLTGAIPPEMGILKNLKDIDIRNTSMSCLGASSGVVNSSSSNSSHDSTAQPPYARCDESQLLPCFLRFSEVTIPLTDGSLMACPAVVRRFQPEAVQQCSGSGAMQLADQAVNLPASHDIHAQAWNINPEYYQYRHCICLKGYHEVWLNNNTLLRCDGNGGLGTPAWVVPVTAIFSIAGIMLLGAAGLLVWLRMTVQLRPRWQREKELIANRKKGMPNGGPATIVVTDIERYSELMQINAPLATRFLGIHNAILRRAVAAHAGHVVEQEGDSWSVAFHTPMDAVAFCLQAQQALAKTQWPGASAPKRSTRNAHADPSRRGSSCSTMRLDGPGTSSSQGPTWMHSLSSAVLKTSANDSTANAAAAAAVSSPSAPGPSMQAARRDGKSKHQAFSMPLPTGQTGHMQPVERSQTSSFSNLIVIGEHSSQSLSSTRLDERQNSPQLISQGIRICSGKGQGTVQSGGSAWQGSGGAITAGRSVCQHELNAAGPERSFSSVPSSPSSMHSNSLQVRDTTGSLRSLFDGLRVRFAGNGSSRGGGVAGPQRTSGSFTADGAAAVGDVAQLSGVSEADQPGKSRDMSASLGLIRPRASNSAAMVPPVASTAGVAVGPDGNRSSAGSRFWAAVGFASGSSQGSLAGERGTDDNSSARVRGLRVRMGMASGCVPRNTNIARCALFELAKAVSDMANGGQILLEASCFEYVRDRLTELGTIDHKGYNDKLLAHATKTLMRQHTSCIFNCAGFVLRCIGVHRDMGPVDTDALILDMGQYYSPALAPLIPSAAAELNSGLTDLSPPALGIQDAAVAAAAAAVMRCPSQDFLLQLYSILPCSLQACAKVWMNQLKFREATQQTARGYFDAPGSGVADLSAAAVIQIDPDRPPLPAVTMVFVKVEHGKALLRRRHDLARLVHSTVVRLLQVMLFALPEHDGRSDGYLCREQEGEFKYMLAFRESARALEWCLLVQEVMQHVPWPKEVIEEYAVVVSESGHVAGTHSWKRPVLRMGLAEGQPHSILPDHLGRADYHGPSVNLAARLMDAAGLGDLVVTSVELADCIFSTWRFEAELGLYDLVGTAQNDNTAPRPDQQQQQQNAPSLGHNSFAMNALPTEPPETAAAAQQRLPREGSLPQQQQQQQAVDASPFEQRMQQLQVHFQQHASNSCEQPRPAEIADSSNNSVSFGLPSLSCGAVGGADTPHMASVTAGVSSGSAGTSHKGPKPSQIRQQLIKELLQRSLNLMDPPDYLQRLVHVSCQHIGTFAFKGCGALDIVTFTTDVVPVAVPTVSSSRSGSKGTLLMHKSGAVPGLQDCPVLLPEVLPALQQAWTAAADVAAAVEHELVLRKQATTRSFDLFRSSPEMERNQGTIADARFPFRRRSISLAPPVALSQVTGSSSGARLPQPKLFPGPASAPLPTLAVDSSAVAAVQNAKGQGRPTDPRQKQSGAGSFIMRALGSFTKDSKGTTGSGRSGQSAPLPAAPADLVWPAVKPAGDQLQAQGLASLGDASDVSFSTSNTAAGVCGRMDGGKDVGSTALQQTRQNDVIVQHA